MLSLLALHENIFLKYVYFLLFLERIFSRQYGGAEIFADFSAISETEKKR